MHLAARKPFRWLVATGILAGGAALLAPRWRLESETAESPAEPTPPAATLGPLPVALPDEPTQPARLSGAIETSLSDLEGTADPLAGSPSAEMQIPPCEPPALGDDPWRPSTRVASYQADIKTARPRPKTPPAAASPRHENAARQAYLTHRIADGDTLSGLAQHYLGSSKRFLEIFTANRDRLASPDLLPIGVELRIPTHAAPAPTAK